MSKFWRDPHRLPIAYRPLLWTLIIYNKLRLFAGSVRTALFEFFRGKKGLLRPKTVSRNALRPKGEKAKLG
jgi:hypothetical protein